MTFHDFLADGIPLVGLAHVDFIILVLSGYRLVGGNNHYLKAINFVELHSLGFCSTGHSRKLVVHTEEVLEGDGGQGSVALGDFNVFLGFDGLMETVTITATFQNTTSKLIYNLNLPVPHHIVYVGLVQGMGTNCLGKVVDIFKVAFVKEASSNEVSLLKDFFNLEHTLIRKGNTAGLFIQLVVTLDIFSLSLIRIFPSFRILFHLSKLANILVHFVKLKGIILSCTGNNQWGSSFID